MTAAGEVLIPHREGDQPGHGAHEEHGINTALLGMLLFIGSEIMFFGGLFAAYFNVRAGKALWPPEGFEIELPLAMVVTAILVTSSVTMQFAVWAIRRGDRRAMNRALTVTLILGV
nr:cytochrome c oxidase subunit 3 [Chloroflexota bacterium]